MGNKVVFKLTESIRNEDERADIRKFLLDKFPNKRFEFWTDEGIPKIHFKRYQ